MIFRHWKIHVNHILTLKAKNIGVMKNIIIQLKRVRYLKQKYYFLKFVNVTKQMHSNNLIKRNRLKSIANIIVHMTNNTLMKHYHKWHLWSTSNKIYKKSLKKNLMRLNSIYTKHFNLNQCQNIKNSFVLWNNKRIQQNQFTIIMKNVYLRWSHKLISKGYFKWNLNIKQLKQHLYYTNKKEELLKQQEEIKKQKEQHLLKKMIKKWQYMNPLLNRFRQWYKYYRINVNRYQMKKILLSKMISENYKTNLKVGYYTWLNKIKHDGYIIDVRMIRLNRIMNILKSWKYQR